jgi:hypothetical protein
MYDPYFQGARPLNKMLYKILYVEKFMSGNTSPSLGTLMIEN